MSSSLTVRHAQQFFELSTDLVCLASFEGYFLELNPRFTEVLGYSIEELTAVPFMDFVHPEDRSLTETEAARISEGARTLSFENRYRTRDGKWVWLQWSAIPIHEDNLIYAVARDITRRRNAELALRERERKLSALFESATDLIQTVDSHGSFTYTNRAWRERLGYPSHQGLNFLDVVAPEEKDACLEVFRDLVQGNRSEVLMDTVFIGRSGERVFVEGAVTLGTLPNGQRVTRAIFRDVTARRRLEAMKQDFISTVSHELRTPLTSIQGSLSLLVGGVMGDLPAEARQLTEIAQSNASRLVKLVDEILDLEKLGSGKMRFDMQSTQLAHVVEEGAARVGPMARDKGVDLRVIVPATPPVVQGDAHRLEQVLGNLLSNAMKYTPRDSQVDIELLIQGPWARVEVRDRGPGIPADRQRAIFNRFEMGAIRDATEHGGTGLGLAICREIVTRHGGRIGVDSVAGRGSTFWFELPVLVDHARRSMLLVQRDRSITELLTRQLEHQGAETVVAYSLEDATVAMRQGNVVVIAADPSVAGIVPWLAEMNAHHPLVQLVVLSPEIDEAREQLSGSAVRVADWLEPPLEPGRLTESLVRWLAVVESPLILHVEDDLGMQLQVKRALSETGRVIGATSIEDARRLLSEEKPDAVILDLGLPDGCGSDLLADLDDIPVVLFSGMTDASHYGEKVAATLRKAEASPDMLRRVLGAHLRSP